MAASKVVSYKYSLTLVSYVRTSLSLPQALYPTYSVPSPLSFEAPADSLGIVLGLGFKVRV